MRRRRDLIAQGKCGWCGLKGDRGPKRCTRCHKADQAYRDRKRDRLAGKTVAPVDVKATREATLTLRKIEERMADREAL